MQEDVFLSAPSINSRTANLIVESNRAFMWTLCFLATEGCTWLVLEAYCQMQFCVPSFPPSMPPANENLQDVSIWRADNYAVASNSPSFIFEFNAEKGGYNDMIVFRFHEGAKFDISHYFRTHSKSELCCRAISPIQIPSLRRKLLTLWVDNIETQFVL